MRPTIAWKRGSLPRLSLTNGSLKAPDTLGSRASTDFDSHCNARSFSPGMQICEVHVDRRYVDSAHSGGETISHPPHGTRASPVCVTLRKNGADVVAVVPKAALRGSRGLVSFVSYVEGSSEAAGRDCRIRRGVQRALELRDGLLVPAYEIQDDSHATLDCRRSADPACIARSACDTASSGRLSATRRCE